MALIFDRLRYCTLAVTLGLAVVGFVSAAPPAQEFTLENGLRLIVAEDHRAPVAVVQIWYRVGSADEPRGLTGVSHVLEHLMFRGTEARQAGEFSRIVAANGGEENAFTSSDYTVYYQQWSRDKVALSFELEADRMRGALLRREEFANELKIVQEERRLRVDDAPRAQLRETLFATAFQVSPIRQPVIGWAHDLENLPHSAVQSWYTRWYVPGNALVVVVGDVDPQAVLTLAQSHFGDLARTAVPVRKNWHEPPQRGPKRVTLWSEQAQVPYLLMGYKAPVLRATLSVAGARPPAVAAWEIYALDVLAATLAGDASARLNKSLFRGRGLATSVSASYSAGSRWHTLFMFSGVPRAGHTLAEIEAALKAEIAAMKESPPAREELELVKTRVVADTLYQQDSLFSRAMTIGSLAVVGLDWRLKDRYVENISEVTPTQVRAVARKYLVDEQLTVAYLLPRSSLEQGAGGE